MGSLFSKKNPQENQMIYGNLSPGQADQLARQFNMSTERVNLLRQKYLQYRGKNHLINVYNFMILYREFVNSNASEVDIYKVFNAFDFDRDGLINFLELLRAVSMQPQVSPTPPPLNPNILQMLQPCDSMSPLPPPVILPPSRSLSEISLPLVPPPPIPLPRYKRKLIWRPPDDYYPTAPRRRLKKVIVYVPRRRPRSYSPPPIHYRRYRPSTRRHYDYGSEPYLDYDNLSYGGGYDTIIRKPRTRVRYADDFDHYY